jgi:N-methyl-L-proline demethylase
MSIDPLLQPYTIKNLTLRNRIITTAHEPAYSDDGIPTDRYRAYHVERARAGIGLTMTAGSASTSLDSPPVFSNLLMWKDEIVPWLARMVDEVHDQGAAIMIQLSHLGRRTRWDKADWLPVVSPSLAREPAHRAFPKRIEDWDMDRIIADYVSAAQRAKAGGVDGIEFEAYGHLLDQFWSPLTNDLAAPYGGDLDNRMRFGFDMLRAVREAVGPDMLIGVRYSVDETVPGGYDEDDGMAMSRRLTDSGLVDFLNVVRGNIAHDAGLTDMIPIQGMRSAPHLEVARRVREETGMPVFHAAKIQDVATARHAVESGAVDMIGMTRAHMADPHIVRKIIAGREDTIRPCVGANYCLDRIYQGGAAYCIHNPATGRELTMPHDIPAAETKRKIMVIGAGPAGLEAARVASARGHDVLLVEAANQAGGQIRLTARSPRRREMMQIVDWRLERCLEQGVRFAFNTWAEADTVLAEKPDVVIVATGGMADSVPLAQGDDLVVTAWDILSGDVKPGSNVLVYDDAGDHVGLQAAEVIAATGAKVEVMTPDRSFAPEVMAMNLVPYMRSLQKLDTTFTVTFSLGSVTREGNQLRAHIESEYGGVDRSRLVDQVVVNHGTVPLDDLYFALKPLSRNLGAVDYAALVAGTPQDQGREAARNPDGAFALYRIGDAVSSRNTHAAIYDALRLVKDL